MVPLGGLAGAEVGEEVEDHDVDARVVLAVGGEVVLFRVVEALVKD